MADQYYNDIPKGNRIPSQIRLDAKTAVQNEAALKNLGENNNLAFTYYEGLEVYCKDEKTEYVWREVIGSETGLLNTNFTYPTYSAVDGINYSNKTFNFFNTDNRATGTETKIIGGTNITVTGNGAVNTPYVINTPTIVIPVVDGSETKLISGTNTTVSGNGTIITPYQISIPNLIIPDGSETKLLQGSNITITGTGTTANPYIINTLSITPADGSETKINISSGLKITGNGTTQSPYLISIDNLQKNISGSLYTVTDLDDNYTIFVQNGITPMTITIPHNLIDKIGIGFIQKGTADVTFVTSGGATLVNPIGFKIKGKEYQVFVEKVLNTTEYNLLGNTKS